MKTILVTLAILASAFMAKAQSELMVFPDWLSTAGSQNFFYENKVKTDASNNVYIAGATLNGSNNYDILLAKYNSRGVLQWIQQYNGAGNGDDIGIGLYIDGSSNVYITGYVTDTNGKNAVTIKYNSSGTQQWLKTYNGTGNDFDSGIDIYADVSGNVYICGTSYNASSNTDIIAIKYNSSGTQQWASRYNYTAQLNDAGVKIKVSSTTVTVTGTVQYDSITYKSCGVAFDALFGQYVSITINGTYTSGVDLVSDMVQDVSGNIYISGSTYVAGQGYDYNVIKLSSNLALLWERTYNGNDDLNDIAQGICVDASGNVYVTGYTTASSEGKNITTIKYNSSGTQQWVEDYNDTIDGDDEASAIALDATGNVYVTGYISTETDNADFNTIKYDASGNLIWQIHGDGDAHLNDMATNIAIDHDQDIVVTGESETAPGTYEYYTVKYVEREIITPTDYNSEDPQSSFQYYRNKGQLIGTNDSLVPDVKFYTTNSSPAFYIQKNSHSFVFAKCDTSASTQDTLQRIDVTYQKKNSDAKTYPLEEQKNYLNYFLPQCPDGITEVRGNQRLVTPDLYTNIDLMYSSNQNGMKFYYIIKPGGDPTDIALEFTGASSIDLDSTSNELTINSSIGSISFDQPTVYQLDDGNNIIDTLSWTADWQYNGDSNVYEFNTGAYDNTKTMVIQVDRGNGTMQANSIANLDWSTYYGGPLDDEFLDVKTDASSNSYVTGYTVSNGFPTYNGMQTQLLGTQDAVIMKFDLNGIRKFATYMGGSSTETGYSILPAKSTGNIYIVGYTRSTNFPQPNPQPAGAYVQASLSGSMNGFILELAPLGNQIIWDTYYGSGNERFNSISEDNNNNLYIVGRGSTTTPLLPLTGAYNNNSAGNGLITKFTTQGARLWATLFITGGGEVNCVKTDEYNNFYITGEVTVNTMPVVDPGSAYIDNSLGGTRDAFIARFNSANSIYWSTYLGGNGSDYGYSIATYAGVAKSSPGGVYVTGGTSSSDFPTYNPGWPAYFDNTLNGTRNTFISKFSGYCTMEWSTYHGNPGNGNDVGTGIIVNDMKEVYVTGYTYGMDPFELTGAYYQSSISNPSVSSDAYLLAFRCDNSERIWSTYFGGSRGEVGRAISIDPLSRLYLVGQAYSSTSDTYPLPLVDLGGGAYWQDDNAGVGHGDGYISRFDLSEIIYGIYESDITSPFIIYPNPNNGMVFVEAELEKNTDIIISVYSIMGQKMKEVKENSVSGAFKTQLDISGYSNGIYIITLDVSGTKYYKKLIKQ